MVGLAARPLMDVLGLALVACRPRRVIAAYAHAPRPRALARVARPWFWASHRPTLRPEVRRLLDERGLPHLECDRGCDPASKRNGPNRTAFELRRSRHDPRAFEKSE